MEPSDIIRTPDQRLRVFVSSTLRELAEERNAVREAITQLRLAPVMFELGARPHPAINLYRAYLEQSHIFIGIYWQSYGYVAPGMEISGLEDEYLHAADKPRLIYIKTPAAEREAGLGKLLTTIKNDDKVSYKYFSSAEELRQLAENDLALVLTERFEVSELKLGGPAAQPGFVQNNLPAQVTSFIGREPEIAVLQELIEHQHARLITLTGPGGTGKTRLCLQVAERLLEHFTDGVLFVSLAEANDPGLVVSKIAELLGVREGGSQTLWESLKSYLRNKNILLLLDNFEQVLKAAPLVSGLLEAAPKLYVMVTSRAVLNIRGEHEFRVPTLRLPDPIIDRTAEQLVDCEAVKMFIERVNAIHPHFVMDEQNAPIIAEICRRLDGLPLAIELAASRVRMLSLDKLLSLLGSRLKVLIGGGKDLPERQQTLRNTLDWSVQLLNQKDQALFYRLGVFMGGFTLEAAQEVCKLDNENELDIIQGIESLVSNSLLKLDYLEAFQPRFRMLETIRDFAQEKLAEGEKLEQLQRRHAQYYIDKMNEVGPKFSTSEADRWLDWVDAEHDNLRAALSFCLKDETLLELGPWLLIAMNWPWYRRGFLSEGRDWADRLLRTTLAKEHMLVRSFAIWSSGAMAMWQGDLNHALAALDEAVLIAKSIEYPMAIAVTLLFLGTTHVNRGEDQIALQVLQEALEIYKQLGVPWYEAITLVHMGNATLGIGEIDKARDYLEQALPISQAIGEKWLKSFILNNNGEVARVEGNYRSAQQYYEESESLLRGMGDKGDLARLVHNLGCVAWHMGNLDAAENRFKDSLAMFIKLGNQRGMAECLASMAGLWTEQGKPLHAAKLMSAAQALLKVTGATWWPADRVEVNRTLDELHKSLKESQFEAAWEEGRKMNLDAAIRYAQEGEI